VHERAILTTPLSLVHPITLLVQGIGGSIIQKTHSFAIADRDRTSHFVEPKTDMLTTSRRRRRRPPPYYSPYRSWLGSSGFGGSVLIIGWIMSSVAWMAVRRSTPSSSAGMVEAFQQRGVSTSLHRAKAEEKLRFVMATSGIHTAFLATLHVPPPRQQASSYLPRHREWHPTLPSLQLFSSSSTSSSSSSSLSSSKNEPVNDVVLVEPMANLYQEWTLDQDQLLWNEYQKKKNKDISELASLLGRGLQGVRARLTKLKDVNSAAYQRLFQQQQQQEEKDGPVFPKTARPSSFEDNKKKLVPVSEVLRRIQWDYRLSASDFSILHYDRVENLIVESPLDTPNQSISGRGTQLIDALPEHRIVGVKYKERIVWDRDERLNLVFANTNNNDSNNNDDGNNNNDENGTGGIYKVIETYDTWIQERDALVEWNRKRQAEVGRQIEELLGTERFTTLKQLSSDLLRDPQVVRHQQRQQRASRNKGILGAPSSQSSAEAIEDAVALKRKVEQYVQSALSLFRQVRKDPSQSLVEDKSLVPATDFLALDRLSELVALLPDTQLRPVILSEISSLMDQSSDPQRGNNNNNNKKSKVHDQQQQQQKRDLVVASLLKEEDLIETYVRGTGPGGQKINKTSNRVVLVHVPTQIKVECQDTRSLQQNRNLARKRLLLKLDEYINGSQSKASIKAQEASTKKSKSLARSKARLERKRQAKQEQDSQVDADYAVEDDDDDDDEGEDSME
jgi:peptide chain release factor